MWVLVDYGNLPKIDKERGLAYVVSTIINRIGTAHLQENEQVVVRLYDGWYDGESLSKSAQKTAQEIEALSPTPMMVSGDDKSFQVKVSVELARSLLSYPAKDILHTYRRRAFPSGLTCVEAPFENCINPSSCPLKHLPDFLTHRKCSISGCTLHPKQIISRAEQKVVDTMLTADLIELSLRRERLAIVSSDFDMWPGISLSVSRGGSVIHVQTKKGQSTDPYYMDGLADRYVQIEAV